MIAAEFARFLGLPLTRRANITDIIDAVCGVCTDTRTSVICVDEIHNLNIATASRPAPLPIRPRPAAGEPVSSYIRRLATANHLRPSYLTAISPGRRITCAPSGRNGSPPSPAAPSASWSAPSPA